MTRYLLCKHERSEGASKSEVRQIRCPDCRYERGMAILGKAVLWFFGLLLALCVLAKVANGGETVLGVMQRQPVYFEDRAVEVQQLKAVQLQDLATAIEAAAENHPPGIGRRDWQALLITVSYAESTWSLRIGRGDCKPHECDGGRARSPWQMHRGGMSPEDWEAMQGLEHIGFQAERASERLIRAWLTCKGSGAPWLTGTLNNYAGRKCTDESWEGLGDRAQIFTKVRARL